MDISGVIDKRCLFNNTFRSLLSNMYTLYERYNIGSHDMYCMHT